MKILKCQQISALIPKEVEEGYYFCTPGKSRKGNAHDWFYTETGCIQYLIEVGTENMQPDSVLIEDTIDRNILYGQLFLQPTRTAEFIVLDFTVQPTGASFPE